MPTLILSTQPGFAEIPASTFDAGNAASAANFKALNAAAMFAAVRTEEFWGYYKNGEAVALPVSPADGYAYVREELRYVWAIYWTGAPPSAALLGSQALPSRGATGGPGNLLQMGFSVDQGNGNVSCNVSYYNGSKQTDTVDGILMVTTIAKRQR